MTSLQRITMTERKHEFLSEGAEVLLHQHHDQTIRLLVPDGAFTEKTVVTCE